VNSSSPETVPEKTPEIVIDARGHHCPVPTLRLRKALAAALPGQRLVLLATDPMARVDVPHFLNESGDLLLDLQAEDKVLRFSVEKRGGAPRS